MDIRRIVKTGDILLFSGNTPTGFLLRTFVSSEWNHSGIAVRFTTDPITSEKSISLSDSGDLYILETNTGTRTDDIFGYDIVGAGFSRADWVFEKYNRVAVRHLHDIFRTKHLADLTLSFANKYRGRPFPTTTLPFIGVWLGIPLVDKGLIPEEMFCSELMAHYYSDCVGPQYEQVTGIPFNGTLSILFGNGAPESEDMYTPGHYTLTRTPNSSIFSGKEIIIYTKYSNLFSVITPPFLLILLFILLIFITLP